MCDRSVFANTVSGVCAIKYVVHMCSLSAVFSLAFDNITGLAQMCFCALVNVVNVYFAPGVDVSSNLHVCMPLHARMPPKPHFQTA